jgi:hypothetical protein
MDVAEREIDQRTLRFCSHCDDFPFVAEGKLAVASLQTWPQSLTVE